MTRKALLLALLCFGLLLAALVTRNGDLALMALPFLAYLGVGIRTAPAREEVRLQAARDLDITPSGGLTTVEVGVTVHNVGERMVSLLLSDPLQPGMKVTAGALRQWAAVAGGEETGLRYTFQAERGSFRWETVTAVASDPFGLFETRLEPAAGAEVQIQPVIRKFRPIPLRPETTLHSPGSIPSRLGGSGTDFRGVREYRPGDPLRRLDWRLTARHPHQFFSKEFELEETADIGLILDARQLVDLRVDGHSLFEHSVNAAASLAEAFLHQGNRVSLLIFENPLKMVFPGYSKMQLNRILRTLAQARVCQTESRLSLGSLPLHLFSSRGLLVILSPLATDDWEIFPRLRAHGNQGLLICPDPFDFALKTFAQDRAGLLGLRAARVERHLELRKIAQLRIRVIDWRVAEPLSPLVYNAFRQSRGGRG